MKETQKTKPQEKDLIDHIADALPLEVRPEYYRTMRHLRSLPENDEMLIILQSMNFLTLLTEQIPSRILTEREYFQCICTDFLTTAKGLEKTGSEYYRQLDKRLTQLPGDIAAGISPRAIVERINDVLRKQFDISTIPIVAKELAAKAEEIRRATKEYKRANENLCNSWQSATEEARQAIDEIQTAVSGAVKTSEQATEAFKVSFDKTYKRILGTLCAFGLVVGIMIGILIFDRLRPYTKTVYEIPRELRILMEGREWERQQQEERFIEREQIFKPQRR